MKEIHKPFPFPLIAVWLGIKRLLGKIKRNQFVQAFVINHSIYLVIKC